MLIDNLMYSLTDTHTLYSAHHYVTISKPANTCNYRADDEIDPSINLLVKMYQLPSFLIKAISYILDLVTGVSIVNINIQTALNCSLGSCKPRFRFVKYFEIYNSSKQVKPMYCTLFAKKMFQH